MPVCAAVRLAIAGGLLIVLAAAAFSQQEPGQFEFYVLSLSWSPSFCDSSEDRGQYPAQCTARPYAFVVHGLWPQNERGFPRSCQIPPPRLPRSIMLSMLDLMPAPRLVYHEWDEHGTCSGLSAGEYFHTVRKAREAIKIPPQYSELKSALSIDPEELKVAFISANPGLTEESIAVECDRKRLREVRICLSKDLRFRACPELTRRSCRHTVIMPPVRSAEPASR
jgi:ribonuclease T2